MATYRDHAVVVRTYKLGEADRIAVLMTRDNGKVRAVVKGARKPRSRLGAHLEPLRHIDLQLYRGRGDLDVVNGVQALSNWSGLRTDLNRLEKALTLAEAVDQVSLDRSADTELYEMLCGALAELDRRDSPLLVPSFLLKVLAHEGMAPELEHCSAGNECANPTPVALDVPLGGVVCDQHRRSRKSPPETLRLLRSILRGGLRDALETKKSIATKEVENLVNAMWEYRVERRLRSRNLLGRNA